MPTVRMEGVAMRSVIIPFLVLSVAASAQDYEAAALRKLTGNPSLEVSTYFEDTQGDGLRDEVRGLTGISMALVRAHTTDADVVAAAQAEWQAIQDAASKPLPETLAPLVDENWNVVGTARLVVVRGSMAVLASTEIGSPRHTWAQQRAQLSGQQETNNTYRAACKAARLSIAASQTDLDAAWIDATNSLAKWQALPASNAAKTAGVAGAQAIKLSIKAQRDIRRALKDLMDKMR